MKTRPILSLLVFLFFFLNSYSQAYDSLVVEDAQWKVIWDDEDTPWLEDEMSGWLLRGDTVIEGLQYKKLYSRVFEEPFSDVITSQDLFGSLREDVENKKVYAIDFQAGYTGCDTLNNEYLLFDFSLNVGDTAEMCILSEWLGPGVLTETYYSFQFGKDRKHFQFNGAAVNFIEGIGHEQGLLESPIINVSSMDTWYLYDYCRGTNEECGVVYVGVDENSLSNSFSVYPNPASDFLQIIIDKHDCRNVVVVRDVFGRCFLKTNDDDWEEMLDISGIPEGIYFVSISDGKNLFPSKKLFILR